MTQKNKIVVANWKNGIPHDGVDNWIKTISHDVSKRNDVTVIVCPSKELFIETQRAIEKYGNVIELGSQNLISTKPYDMYDDIPGSFA